MTGAPEDRPALRATFDEGAGPYDRARPTCPPAVSGAILDRVPWTGRPAPRVLEIGCGTGQATRSLAERGCDVLAVDLGADMVRVARSNVMGFGDVEIVRADADHWSPAETDVDLVVCATAFHWLRPATRFTRSARVLPPGGAARRRTRCRRTHVRVRW